MSSLVLELQQEALNSDIALPDLLRKALVVAKKLNISEFQTWVENKLNGYPNIEQLPDYRKIYGTPQAFNIVYGWVPIVFDTNESKKYWSLCTFKESIAQLSSLVSNEPNSTLQTSYSAEAEKSLLKSIGCTTSARVIFSNSVIANILDTVRTIVLNWALKLEDDHILGKDMTFTPQEKQTAQSTTYNINNFYGLVESSQLQQQTSGSIQIAIPNESDKTAIHEFIEAIKANLHVLELTNEVKDELNAELSTLAAQISSPKPKGSILNEGIASVRRILESAGGTIAAELLLRLNSMK